MSDLDEIRARYRAKKASLPSKGVGRAIGRAKRAAKADARVRAYIERWLAGETHQEIADSIGVTQAAVTRAITAYRKRHLDTPIPRGPQKIEP
jgi:DNA invertase Pin-like site-specific DNA recombinase